MLRVKNKLLAAILSVVICIVTISPHISAYAETTTIPVPGTIYDTGEKGDYIISDDSITEEFNSFGTFSITGDLVQTDSVGGIDVYTASSGNVDFNYKYSLSSNEDETEWHLVEDSGKKIAGSKLSDKIGNGAILIQTSKDGTKWIDEKSITNVFVGTNASYSPIYSTKGIQLVNGCYYRVIVAYKLERLVGENKVLFIKTDDKESKKIVEVYQFYISDGKNATQADNTRQKKLGETVRTNENKGYTGQKAIEINDPHYGWELGKFFVSGYTRDTEDSNKTPVFLKNVGDQITLWFKLEHDIDHLNGSDSLEIIADKDGYDQYFQTPKTNTGRGMLIIRYTNEQGVKQSPEIYTNYLAANVSANADTVVRLFEEGDYEVALDYRIKSTPRKIKDIEVVPENSDYRIFFKFSVRNGNCMVYPFDTATGAELSNSAITKNGFKLDMARSRYLNIDVQRSVVSKGANGYVEDVRFNRPAKDGDSYQEEGIYTFDVKNLYTGEHTTKTIYVGSSDYMKALAVNNYTVDQLNEEIKRGKTIQSDGTLSYTKTR
ncbi:MAG: hypothetical protein IJX83_13150 [Lachnospiraceae bacterium]|nr:hypothetical protein [Lachnospiraceae bacterium]